MVGILLLVTFLLQLERWQLRSSMPSPCMNLDTYAMLHDEAQTLTAAAEPVGHGIVLCRW